MSIPIVSIAMFVAQAARRRPWTFSRFIRGLGVFGLFLLAILDSTPIPTLGGVDILIAILSARHAEPWYYYAMVATAGSLLGAYLTFHTARRGGADYLQKKFGERRVARLLDLFHRWGTGGLAVSSAVPFPFPTSAFFAAAGVLDYPVRRFIMVVALARAARYATLAAVASRYGRHFIRVLRNPSQYWGWLAAIAVGVALLVLSAVMVRKRMQAAA